MCVYICVRMCDVSIRIQVCRAYASHSSVLSVSYEELLRDLPALWRRLEDFLGVPHVDLASLAREARDGTSGGGLSRLSHLTCSHVRGRRSPGRGTIAARRTSLVPLEADRSEAPTACTPAARPIDELAVVRLRCFELLIEAGRSPCAAKPGPHLSVARRLASADSCSFISKR